MSLVLVKREDGTAAVLGAIEREDGSHYDVEQRVAAADIVDGRLVSEWPAGVHKLSDEASKPFAKDFSDAE